MRLERKICLRIEKYGEVDCGMNCLRECYYHNVLSMFKSI